MDFSGSKKSHKRSPNTPTLLVHGTATTDAAPSTGLVEEWWAEDLATNEARLGPGFTYRLGDGSLEPQFDQELADGITVVIATPVRNANSDRPLKTWYPKEDQYIEEQLRREGRGSAKVYSKCAGPGVLCNDRDRQCLNRECAGVAEFRCVDQACFGEVMRCRDCIVAAHAQLPMHFIEEWDGTKFKHSRTGLKDLGLRMQLGHPPGVVCTSRYSARNDFVVYDLSGVHEVALDYCGCEPQVDPHVQLLRAYWCPATVLMPNTCATFALLRLFHVINCLGKLSAYDFLRGLEICTDHDGLDKPPDRRKPFMHIMRQYHEVKRMKRAARGHDAGGAKATKQGELALKCRACPQPGWNLPEGWERVDPVSRFLYFMFLAVDANFRLSNHNISSELADPILGDGLGFFCKREGNDGYKTHIAQHVSEQEMSTCSGFQAMFKQSQRVKGLRTTGIGGVTCSRHNMWQGNGIGDLQLGERYIVIYLFALQHGLSDNLGLDGAAAALDHHIIQYRVSILDTLLGTPDKFPVDMKPKIKRANVWWKVPNFHLPPNKRPCHSPYSFHFMLGLGMTHGEDRVLPKRLAVSIKEGLKHRAAFNSFNAGLEAVKPAEVAVWRESVLRWEAKQHTKADEYNPKDCRFDGVEEVAMLREIQLEIAAGEFICMDNGIEVEREHSPGTFISMALDLENLQRRLEMDVWALKDPTPAQKLAFTKKRTVVLKRIHKLCQVQAVYMPSLQGSLTPEQRQMFDGNGEQLPEVTRLFLPSEIMSEKVRLGVCAIGLPEIERCLRVAEAEEALEGVRQGLRTRTMTNRFRLRNYTGQGMMTKGQGILRQIKVRISIAKLRYRYAHAALLVLQKPGP
ncbi:hypothetical protein DFH06DRAFT_1130542 [Mycena polygramma]|nr:hypothetical protein DFH06DRAFT_1130542 [Mycena polygramma]